MTETDRYAEQTLLTRGATDHARLIRWKPTNFEEITTFIGLMILMDPVHTPLTCISIATCILSTTFIRATNL